MNPILAKCIRDPKDAVLITAITDGIGARCGLLGITVTELTPDAKPEVFLLRDGTATPAATEQYTGLNMALWLKHAQPLDVAMIPMVQKVNGRIPIGYGTYRFLEPLLRSKIPSAFDSFDGTTNPFIDSCVIKSATDVTDPWLLDSLGQYENFTYAGTTAMMTTMYTRLREDNQYYGLEHWVGLLGLEAQVASGYPAFLRKAMLHHKLVQFLLI